MKLLGTLDKNMNPTNAVNIVIKALQRATKIHWEPHHWTYRNNDGSETVEFFMGKAESKYVYTIYSSFLGFRYGHKTFTLSSSDPYLDFEEWHRLGDILNNVNMPLLEN